MLQNVLEYYTERALYSVIVLTQVRFNSAAQVFLEVDEESDRRDSELHKSTSDQKSIGPSQCREKDR